MIGAGTGNGVPLQRNPITSSLRRYVIWNRRRTRHNIERSHNHLIGIHAFRLSVGRGNNIEISAVVATVVSV